MHNNLANYLFPLDLFPFFSILLWNVRSLLSRCFDFSSILHHNNCAFALLSETWISPFRNATVLHYHLIRSDHPEGYSRETILSYHSIQINPILNDPTLYFSLSEHLIDIMGINAFVNTSHPLQL